MQGQEKMVIRVTLDFLYSVRTETLRVAEPMAPPVRS